MDYAIEIEPPRQPELLEFIDQGTALAESLYPPESNFLLDVDELERDGVALYVARDLSGRALGMAALVQYGDGVAEIKRMFVDSSARGLGVGRGILDHLEKDAARGGITRIVLETGPLHHAAIALYKACGFTEVPPFGQYIGAAHSVCMAKDVAATT